jgi:NADPH-dependent FMN reductase
MMPEPPPTIRKGAPAVTLSRDEFRTRFRARFLDPAYEAVATEVAAVEEVAWDAYTHHRKAPRTRAAGPGFADPSYELSLDWLATRDAIHAAQARHDEVGPPRILVVAGGSRNEHTCPGEQSKTQRLVDAACAELRRCGAIVELLDLSRVTAEYGRVIHPCKGCVSTAMPLCHWPCSCYPNHETRQAMRVLVERVAQLRAVPPAGAALERPRQK